MATDLDPEKQAQLGLRRTQQQPAQAQPRLGMTLTPEQISANTKKEQIDRSRERQAEFRAGVGNTLDRVGNSAINLANMPGRIAIEGARQIGDFVGNTRFDSNLPDYGNRGLNKRRAENFVQNNPEQAEAARLGLRSIADRASSSAIDAVKAAPPAQAAPTGAPGLGLLKPASAQPVGQGIQDAMPPAGASDVERSSSGHVDGAAPRLGFQRTSVDGVVGRVGQDGTLEFSNAAGDVAGADDNPLTAGRMGNGVGSLSVGEPGDSQLALERFQRANDIRAQTIQDQRRGQIGENGGLSIVRDSTRAPTFAELQNERLGLRRQARDDRRESEQARLGLRHRELDTAERTAASELGLRERELAGNERLAGLEEQRLGLQMRTGEMELAQQQRIEDMRTQLADPNLDPATRAQLERAYNALTTPARDRYMLQDSIMGYDMTGAPILGKSTLDVTTGQMVGQDQQPSRRSSVSREEVERTAKARGMTTDEVIKRLAGAGVTVSN